MTKPGRIDPVPDSWVRMGDDPAVDTVVTR